MTTQPAIAPDQTWYDKWEDAEVKQIVLLPYFNERWHFARPDGVLGAITEQDLRDGYTLVIEDAPDDYDD